MHNQCPPTSIEAGSLLAHLRQFADGLVALLGNRCEVCIHDLDNLERSLIYINGTVTGRPIGAPATDLLTKALQQPDADIKDQLRYRTTTMDGRVLSSSTMFFRDKVKRPAFALCINLDTTDYFNAYSALESLLPPPIQSNHAPSQASEMAPRSPAEMVAILFEQAVCAIGKQPATMNVRERILLVKQLKQSGALQFKGAVEQIAALAGISKYTVYHYLRQIRSGSTESSKNNSHGATT